MRLKPATPKAARANDSGGRLPAAGVTRIQRAASAALFTPGSAPVRWPWRGLSPSRRCQDAQPEGLRPTRQCQQRAVAAEQPARRQAQARSMNFWSSGSAQRGAGSESTGSDCPAHRPGLPQHLGRVDRPGRQRTARDSTSASSSRIAGVASAAGRPTAAASGHRRQSPNTSQSSTTLVSSTTNTGSSSAVRRALVGHPVRRLVIRGALEYNRRLFGRFMRSLVERPVVG